MARLIVHPQKTPLSGSIVVPGDKSISHRAVMFAALAEGPSTIRNWLPAGDTLATLEIVAALGAESTTTERSPQSWDLNIEGRGLHGLQAPLEPLDCRNAGTCMRLLTGILAGQAFPSVLDGSDQLRTRPMGRITQPLRPMGALIEDSDGRAPLRIKPSSLRGIDYVLPVASAQIKSAILLAGLYARTGTTVRQPGPARDHTERMLGAMGAPIEVDGNAITLRRLPKSLKLRPLDLTVPGDISSAAFLLVAAAIVPHSQVTILDAGHNETRTGLLEILYSMGAQISIGNRRVTGGEPAADMTVHFEEMHSTTVGGDVIVRAIDEFPVWAVAATQAAGDSTVRDAAELRVKEVDRISLLATELGKMGAKIGEQADGFTVSGPTRLSGAEVDSHGDHRLGMALAVAGLVARGPILIQNAGCIADSFPGFVETMRTLGANVEWE